MTGALFKVTPAGVVTPVNVGTLDITGADGIYFRNKELGLTENLLVTANSVVYEFASSDNWATATLFRKGKSFYSGGTTITVRGTTTTTTTITHPIVYSSILSSSLLSLIFMYPYLLTFQSPFYSLIYSLFCSIQSMMFT